MKDRALIIFRCVADHAYYAAHAGALPQMTRELVEFMRACGTCSSWAWHADSDEAYEAARVLVRVSSTETISRATPASLPRKRRAA